MGATFPYALAVWLNGREQRVAARVGQLYAVNVSGAVIGAIAGGFLLLPLAGSRATLMGLSAIYVCCGCLVTAIARPDALKRTAIGVSLFAASALSLPDVYSAVLSRRYGREELVFQSEGVQTTATVHRQASGTRVLYLDGLHQANDSAPMVRIHAEIGHLPMALHPNPRRALVIGLGGGVTAGAVASHGATRTDVVELAGSVVAASPFFSHVNGSVLQRPNVRLRIDDGRNHLSLTTERYDVITADIIQPFHAGAGNLYSLEYFRLARRVLRRGGLMLQWIGQREETHYRLIMRTFLEAFPDATLWVEANLLVGSLEPLRVSREAFERRLADPAVRAAFARVGLETFDALIAKYTAGPDEMRRFLGPGPVLTDDRPLVEYHRSIRQTGRVVDVRTLVGDVRRHVQ
jgi:spermidine synthase